MNEYIVYKDKSLVNSNSPATHVLIIGVGNYPHLPGGSSEHKTESHGGMKQLSSPPLSARKIADWCAKKFKNRNKPLGSISLLVSESNPAPLKFEGAQNSIIPKPANISNVKAAVEEWFELGDKNEENLLVFFFCGHGIAKGIDEQALLLEDYGKSRLKPMEGSIDFMAFQRGMRRCAASQQCFFIDACRVISDIAIDTTEKGDSIIQDSLERPYSSIWEPSVFFSTVGGEAAYGRNNQVSLYTEHLLDALNGTGSDDREPDGIWRVSTNHLQIALSESMRKNGPQIQVPMAGKMTKFYINELAEPPRVPVTIYCNPEIANNQAKLSYLLNGNIFDTREPRPEPWIATIQCGYYEFVAEVLGIEKDRKNRSIRPPARDVELEVKL
ncbi:MAG: caspase family protein [bacterium]